MLWLFKGGAPWGVKIPLAGVMTIGFDVSKDSQNKNNSYGCLVATMDLKSDFSFFATVSTYSSSEKLSNEFGLAVRKAIVAFREKYGALPKKLIIYRGGVGDGDIPYVKGNFIPNLDDNHKDISERKQEMCVFLQLCLLIGCILISSANRYGSEKSGNESQENVRFGRAAT